MQQINRVNFDFFTQIAGNEVIRDALRKSFNTAVKINARIKAAQTRRRLNELSDHMLRDIGVDRDQIPRYGR